MADQIFTRAYLYSIPEQKKQQMIKNLILNFQNEVIANAAKGLTHYMLTTERVQPYKDDMGITFTYEELIVEIQKKFPDSKISYKETWVDTARDTRVLKKGILIDWS